MEKKSIQTAIYPNPKIGGSVMSRTFDERLTGSPVAPGVQRPAIEEVES